MNKGGTPQNLKPFPKGKSGNPAGRVKKLPELDKLLADVLGEEAKRRCRQESCRDGRLPDGSECPSCDGGRKTATGMTIAEGIIRAILAKASRGDLRAAEILLDRGYGKPKQHVDMTTNGEAIPAVTIHVLPPTNGGDE